MLVTVTAAEGRVLKLFIPNTEGFEVTTVADVRKAAAASLGDRRPADVSLTFMGREVPDTAYGEWLVPGAHPEDPVYVIAGTSGAYDMEVHIGEAPEHPGSAEYALAPSKFGHQWGAASPAPPPPPPPGPEAFFLLTVTGTSGSSCYFAHPTEDAARAAAAEALAPPGDAPDESWSPPTTRVRKVAWGELLAVRPAPEPAGAADAAAPEPS